MNQSQGDILRIIRRRSGTAHFNLAAIPEDDRAQPKIDRTYTRDLFDLGEVARAGYSWMRSRSLGSAAVREDAAAQL